MTGDGAFGTPSLAALAARRAAWRSRIGLCVLTAVALFSLLGPMLIRVDPARQVLADSLSAPGAAHWLGTDVLGRDVLARLAHAARLSLGLALLAAVTAAVPGVLLGIAASWHGGRVERALVMLSDTLLSVPGLLLVLLFAALAPGRGEALYVGLALSLWVEYFRVARAATRPVLAGDAVQASRLLGFGSGYVLRRHLLPALAPVMGMLLAFSAAQAVLALAALGFVGVGLQPPTSELGSMMTEYLPHYEEAPWLIGAPVALLMLLVLGMMLLVGDGEGA